MVDGLFDLENRALLEAGSTRPGRAARRLLVIDASVDRIYGGWIRRYLAHPAVEHQILVLPVSETEKTMDSVFRVVKAIDEFGVSRRHEPVIAIGGGVLLDIVGLANRLDHLPSQLSVVKQQRFAISRSLVN